MKLCKIHPHSSELTAARCWEEMAGKRADRKILRTGALWQRNVKMVKYNPPKVVVRRGVTFFIFQEDKNMPYN